MKRPREELPPRLIDGGTTGDGDSEAAALLKKFDRQAAQLPPEEAVWNRTLARLMRESRRHRWRLVFATACGVVLGATGTQVFFALRAGSSKTAAHVQSQPTTPERGKVAGDAEARPPRTAVGAGAQPAPYPAGKVAGAAHARSPQADHIPTLREEGNDAGTAAARLPGAVAQADPITSSHEAGSVAGGAAARSPQTAAETNPIPSPREAGRGLGRGDGRSVEPQVPSDPPRLRLTATATALPRGPSELIAEAEVVLSAEGSAWATAEPQAAVVELDAGRISLHVEKRAPDAGRRFDVRAGGYRFTVLGTRFEVARSEGGVRLSVSEGRVGVFRGETRLTIVGAGGEWSSDAIEAAASASPATVAMTSPSTSAGTQPTPPSPTTAPPPLEPPSLPAPPLAPPPAVGRPSPPGAPAPARPGPGSSCRPGARGDARQLLNCYLNEARGTGLTAEVALYEAARLRRDNLTDLPGALQLLREHRRRFPTGTLAYEVRLSMAELLPKLARYREALTDIDWLLDAHTGTERRGELLLLRGHVLREGFENWAGAERAYAQAAEARGGDGRAADPASFWRAVCLESLGRKDEARRAYAAYLTRPHPSLREQAELRLHALERAVLAAPLR